MNFHNYHFIFRNCNFISHNCEFISHNCFCIYHILYLISQLWLYISHNSTLYFIFCNCVSICHNCNLISKIPLRRTIVITVISQNVTSYLTLQPYLTIATLYFTIAILFLITVKLNSNNCNFLISHL